MIVLIKIKLNFADPTVVLTAARITEGHNKRSMNINSHSRTNIKKLTTYPSKFCQSQDHEHSYERNE